VCLFCDNKHAFFPLFLHLPPASRFAFSSLGIIKQHHATPEKRVATHLSGDGIIIPLYADTGKEKSFLFFPLIQYQKTLDKKNNNPLKNKPQFLSVENTPNHQKSYIFFIFFDFFLDSVLNIWYKIDIKRGDSA